MIVITTINALPDYCHECPCHDGESGYCQADKERRYSEYRPYWCPLKEIDEKQRPTGHWIVKKDKNEECYGVCSECGKEQIVGMLNYCPYCGAEMANRRSNHDRSDKRLTFQDDSTFLEQRKTCQDCVFWKPGYIKGEDDFIPPMCRRTGEPKHGDCFCTNFFYKKSEIGRRKRMTADERIEKLLSRFGQTISNLPKPENKKYSYGWYTMQHLDKAAREWGKKDAYFDWAVVADYACHLCDVIDRLEIALETAARLTSCGTCANEFLEECKSEEHCNYRVCDWCLRDEVTKEEVERIDDAD